MARSGLLTWRPAHDREILAAIERQADVHKRWLAAQTEAREAVEAIAKARAEDESKRADAVAAGKPDPGPKALADLEAAADDAAGRRDVLAEGFKRARAAALAVADEREAQWTDACETAVAKASEAVSTAVAELERALAAWTEAGAELRLAGDAGLRERGRVSSPIPALDGLRQPSGEAYLVPVVIEALRALAETPEPVEVEVEAPVPGR